MMSIKLLLKLKINRIYYLIIILPLLFFNSGCSAPGVLATGAGSTMVIAEGDKSLGSTIDDATIKIMVSGKLLKEEKNLFLDIDVKVTEGRVLLTGIVQKQESRISAVKKTWEVEGVKEVINEIDIGDKATLKEYANDVWITTQIKTLATKNIGLRALAYNYETIKGKVYIAGITSREEQLDTLIKIIKSVKGVKEIVNYVIIKDSE